MRIKFKKTAVEDMRATERYIREQLNNPSAAAKLTRRVYDAIMLLEDNPFMGTELCSRYGHSVFSSSKADCVLSCCGQRICRSYPCT